MKKRQQDMRSVRDKPWMLWLRDLKVAVMVKAACCCLVKKVGKNGERVSEEISLKGEEGSLSLSFALVFNRDRASPNRAPSGSDALEPAYEQPEFGVPSRWKDSQDEETLL